ncbi:MAG: TetR/AcrR family transcriptional regulator [Oscillospiraceae bacterium]|jgi:AcrR family transcriptional regulator|nr:TetR/AcrR family transcriptional regulator [Oscillospiraceae bacterium]
MYDGVAEVIFVPRNKYPEETVKKILDVSLKLFLEKGYEQTTVLDIVDNLGGLTRGAFYHHFKSKEEVLTAIFENEYAECNPFVKAKQMNAANGLERLKLALKLGLNNNIENEQRKAMTSMAHSLMSNPRFLAEHIKGIQQDSKDLALIMEEGMADGSLKQGNAKVLAELFMLLSNVWMLPGIFPADEDEMILKLTMLEEIFVALGYNFIEDEMGHTFFEILDTLEV